MKKDELLKKIGARIVALREKQNLSQSDLARLTGKDRQNINRLEKGGRNVGIYQLHEVATALKIKLIELVDVE